MASSNKRMGEDESNILEQVTFPVRTSHFERFFLLAVDIRVNGDRIELEETSRNSLQFKISRQFSKVSCERLLSAASKAGKEHGVSHVARLCCGQFPVFEVDFADGNDVFTLLTSLQSGSYQKQLESLLSEHPLSEMDSLSIAVRLFLAVPVRNNDARLTEVTSVNYKNCLETLWQGARFDYRSVLSDVEVSIIKEVLEVEKHLAAVTELTIDVVHWYTLGVFLNVRSSSLERIKLQYGGYTKEGSIQMFRAWMETGHATWPDLVHALCKMGHCLLAKQIAAKIGWVTDNLMQNEVNESFQNVEEIAECQQKLKEQERQLMDQQKQVEDAKTQQKVLLDRLEKMEECLQVVTTRVIQLECEKKDLTVVLSNKEEQHKEMVALRENARNEEVFLTIISDLKKCVHDMKQEIKVLEEKISGLRTEESQLKQALETKHEQLIKCQKLLKDRSKKLDRVKDQMKAERRMFDLTVQRVTVSSEKRHAEQAAQISFLQEEMRRKDLESYNLEMYGMYIRQLEQQQQSTGMQFGESHNLLEKFHIEGDSFRFGWHQYTSRFLLAAEESDGSPLHIPASEISCQLTTSSNPHPVICSISELSQGKYEVSYTPVTIGPHQLKVMVRNKDIRGSPFGVQVFSSIHPKMKGEPVHTIPGIKCPLSVAVSISGMIVVSHDNAEYCMTVLNKNGRMIRSIGPRGRSPGQIMDMCGIALTTNEQIVVADGGKKHINLFSMDGQCINSFGTQQSGLLHYPSAVAVHPSGQIFVVDNGSNRVTVFNPDLSFSHSFGKYGTQPGEFLAPCGVAVDRQGKVFVADSGNNRVQVFSSSGHFVTEFSEKGLSGESLSDPVGIAVDASDYVYVGDCDVDTVSVFNTSGQFISSFGRGESGNERLTTPSGLSTDCNGNLYVCDYGNNRLVIF